MHIISIMMCVVLHNYAVGPIHFVSHSIILYFMQMLAVEQNICWVMYNKIQNGARFKYLPQFFKDAVTAIDL